MELLQNRVANHYGALCCFHWELYRYSIDSVYVDTDDQCKRTLTRFPPLQRVVLLDDKTEREPDISLSSGKLSVWSFCENSCGEWLSGVTHLDDYEVKKI